MRGSPSLVLICIIQLLLSTGCVTLRPGNDGFRVIAVGYASQLPNEPVAETMRRADTEAQLAIGIYISGHDVTRKKFAGLFDLSFDHSNVLMYASRAEIIKQKTKIEAGERIFYSYAAIPLAAPNAYLSGGLSILFPGLGQLYQKRGGLGHLALGAIGIGLILYNCTEYDRWHSKYKRETKIDLINDYYDQSNTWYRYTQISLAAYGLITIFSAVDAFTLARSNQWLLDQLRQGGIRTGDNMQFMIVPQYGQLAVVMSYGF